MTCIVGLQHEGRIWLAGDSAGVDDSFGLEVRAEPKVFRRGEMLFGFAGSFRFGNVLRYELDLPRTRKAREPHEYMATIFVRCLRDTMLKAGVTTKDDNRESIDGAAIIGYQGRLFVIYEDFQVGMPADEYLAIGVGADPARGSLFSTQHLPPKDRVLMALAASERHCAGVRAPFRLETL